MAYTVFVRNWWKYEDGRKVPDPRARKHTLAKGIYTEEEAQAIARQHNNTHKPGALSRKAEYTKE